MFTRRYDMRAVQLQAAYLLVPFVAFTGDRLILCGRMSRTLSEGQRVALSGRNHGVRPLWLIEESAMILVRCPNSALSSPSRLDIGCRRRTLREEGNHDACYGFDRAWAQGM